MKIFKISTVFALLLLISCSTHEHETSGSSFTETPVITNDISNQKVTSFVEDDHGHIWIGTFRGLNRFNVYEFHQHFCTSDERTLPDNQIQCLYKDSRSRLWVSSVNGMALYTEQDDFIRIIMDVRSKNSVQILEDSKGRIYINTMVEIALFDEEKMTFSPVLTSVNNEIPAAAQCFISPDDDIIVASSTHLNTYDSQTYELKSSVELPGYPSYFYMDKSGIIWMSVHNGMALYDISQSCFIPVPKSLNSKEFTKNTRIIYISIW